MFAINPASFLWHGWRWWSFLNAFFSPEIIILYSVSVWNPYSLMKKFSHLDFSFFLFYFCHALEFFTMKCVSSIILLLWKFVRERVSVADNSIEFSLPVPKCIISNRSSFPRSSDTPTIVLIPLPYVIAASEYTCVRAESPHHRRHISRQVIMIWAELITHKPSSQRVRRQKSYSLHVCPWGGKAPLSPTSV